MFTRKPKLTIQDVKSIVLEQPLIDFTAELAQTITDKVFSGDFEKVGDGSIKVWLVFKGKPTYDRRINDERLAEILKEKGFIFEDYDPAFPFGWIYILTPV